MEFTAQWLKLNECFVSGQRFRNGVRCIISWKLPFKCCKTNKCLYHY